MISTYTVCITLYYRCLYVKIVLISNTLISLHKLTVNTSQLYFHTLILHFGFKCSNNYF